MTAILTACSILTLVWAVLLTISAYATSRHVWYVDMSDLMLSPVSLLSLGAAFVGASYLIFG